MSTARSSTSLAALPASITRLIVETATGDHDALHRLYQATGPKLFGVILRICKDRPIGEVVLRETFLRIWRRAASYDPAGGEAMTWMAVIARHTAIDAIRQRHALRLPSADDEDLLDLLPDPSGEGPDPADLSGLRKCLEALEDQQRRCVLLAYYEGYSREELAIRFDRPVGTIKTWLHRGLALLRDCLER